MSAEQTHGRAAVEAAAHYAHPRIAPEKDFPAPKPSYAPAERLAALTLWGGYSG